MAMINAQSASHAFQGFQNLSWMRQLVLMVGLAVSVALGVGLVMWSQQPHLVPLYGHLSDSDASDIAEVLNRHKITYEVDRHSGALLVPHNKERDVKLKLAKEGLPHGAGFGFELLEKKSGFGTSQFMEMAQYKRALEGEMARTITGFRNVRSARVHLALPKQTVFVNDKRRPTASVFVDLFAGRILTEGEVAAIGNLVASSIPQMSFNDVTIVDQSGHLLSHRDNHSDLAVTSQQLQIKRQIEQDYSERIQHILMPILGEKNFRTEVSAEVNFTVIEKTQETFDPEGAVRSSQLMQEQRGNAADSAAVPGALSNVPAATTEVSAGAASQKASDEVKITNATQTLKKQSNNYELDKTISHTKGQPWQMQRLSVAVAIDKDISGSESTTTLSKEDVDHMTLLIKDAVGYNESRGDSVSLVSIPFHPPDKIESLPKESIMNASWFWPAVKQGGALLLLLFLILGVLRPAFRNLSQNSNGSSTLLGNDGSAQAIEDKSQVAALPNEQLGYEQTISAVKNMADRDPARVAQVVKKWVEDSDE